MTPGVSNWPHDWWDHVTLKDQCRGPDVFGLPISDISRCNATTHAAMQNLDKQIRKSRIAIPTILPIFLYGSECWAVTKRDVLKIDALDQWCLRKLLGIKWYHHMWNEEVRWTTGQPRLSAIVQARRLSLFGHIARMPDETDARNIKTAPLRRTGGDHQDVLKLHGWRLSSKTWGLTISLDEALTVA